MSLHWFSHATLGALLLAENVRSVRHRYPNDPPDRTDPYRFRPVDPDRLRLDWVITQCRCLMYQSCESPDYDTTLARAITAEIAEHAIDLMIDGAPWGIEDHHLAP